MARVHIQLFVGALEVKASQSERKIDRRERNKERVRGRERKKALTNLQNVIADKRNLW